MNILVISDFNIGGQCTALAKAINKYTDHEARCIVSHDDHFAFDYDILLNKDNLQEAADLANNWADFFHFGSYIYNWPGVDFNKLVTPHNTVIKYYGSFLRDRGKQCRDFHEKTGIAAITGTDYTITGLLPNSFYHLGSYFIKFGEDPDKTKLLMCKRYHGAETFRICAGSAGHPMKGYPILEQVIKELQDEGVKVELDLISGVSNEEALKRKLNCHACFCSLAGGWGISGVESMFMGQPTFTNLDPFILSMYPDNPSVIVNKGNLKEKIREIACGGFSSMIKWQKLSEESFMFAMRHFKWRDIIKRYMYIIDLIRHKDEYLAGGRSPDEIY